MARRREPPDTGFVFEDVAEYEAALASHGGPPLSEARVFEIGFGAHPYRLIALLSMGVDARGVDAEVPVLHGKPSEYRAALRHNGAERALKSFVRRTLFDGRIWADFESELGRRGLNLEMPSDRFLVSDAALSPIEPGSLDLVYSEDVFEHIALPSLQALLPKLATWLKPDGLALI